MMHRILVLALLVFAFGETMKGNAMSRSGVPEVSCKAAHDKVTFPDALCELFQARLAAQRPDWQAGAVTLVVGASSGRQFMAHVEGDGWQGEPRAAMLSGGRLTEAQITGLMDELIAGMPNQ